MNTLLSLLILVPGIAPPATPRFAPLPARVASFGAAVAGDHLYVYGGHIGKTHQYSTEAVTGRFARIPLTGGKWEELPGGPSIQGLALVAHEGKLYRIGGMQPRNKPGDKADNHSLASCACYDPAARKWTALPDMPAGRSSHDAVVVGNRLFVVGGWCMQGSKGSTWHETALVLDLSKTSLRWQSIPQPFRRRALGAAVVAGKIHVVGGLGAGGSGKQVEILDPATNKWTRGLDIPSSGGRAMGFSPATCVLSGRLHFSGADGKIHRLDDSGWQHVGTQAVRRLVHRMVPGPDGALIIVGGASRDDDARQVEEVRPVLNRRTSGR